MQSERNKGKRENVPIQMFIMSSSRGINCCVIMYWFSNYFYQAKGKKNLYFLTEHDRPQPQNFYEDLLTRSREICHDTLD